jgi:hypothetical protein
MGRAHKATSFTLGRSSLVFVESHLAAYRAVARRAITPEDDQAVEGIAVMIAR